MAQSKICILCGNEISASQALRHKNELLGRKFTICKVCANEKTDFTDEQSVINMCQLANLPFVHTLMVDVLEGSEDPTFGKYMRKLAPYKKYVDFADSQYGTSTDMEPGKEVKITDDMILRWGDQDAKMYPILERKLNRLMDIKPATTSLEVERYVQNIKLGEVLDASINNGDVKAIPQLRKAYDDDLKSIGLDEVLNSKDASAKSVGQRIKDAELKRPIPEREEYDDPAGLKEYFNKYFVIPMKRTFGLANEEEVNSLYEDEKKG